MSITFYLDSPTTLSLQSILNIPTTYQLTCNNEPNHNNKFLTILLIFIEHSEIVRLVLNNVYTNIQHKTS